MDSSSFEIKFSNKRGELPTHLCLFVIILSQTNENVSVCILFFANATSIIKGCPSANFFYGSSNKCFPSVWLIWLINQVYFLALWWWLKWHPYKRMGEICLSNREMTSFTDTSLFVLIACRIILAIRNRRSWNKFRNLPLGDITKPR